ncbi:hypothetical protein L5G28_07565 [Gordonia sp. HY285]|uniref:hypothetical protein n=1 Tax=Gordonia liuliyuniae TaxID=2911517 RepID=UPI001F2ECAA2|nr:hypothetical protein [Gordonia liuliyuniae]MCF8610018.1 hypothetical protein [Gordonia liuliyuniae]
MTIDPATCPADTPFWVRVSGVDRDVIGQRVDPDDCAPWSILANYGEQRWCSDRGVTVLRPADQQPTKWEILRQARQVVSDTDGNMLWLDALSLLANRLEAEHKAAQQADARFAEAERVFKEAWHEADSRGDSGNRVRSGLRAVVDAGLLAEAVTEK